MAVLNTMAARTPTDVTSGGDSMVSGISASTRPPESSTLGGYATASSHVVLPWIVRLRWVSLVALAAAGWAAQVFWRVQLPLLALVLLAALAATNGVLTLQLRTPVPRRSAISIALLLDVGLLTGILYLVGGPLNPFSIIYLVETTFAAITLGHAWAIAVAAISNLAYGVTFFYSRPLEFSDPIYSGRVMTLHLSGMWVALAAASALIAHFVSRVSEALERREIELTQVRAAAARSDRLAALLSLGAGAAHELATPLSTISTAANELAHQLQAKDDHSLLASQYAAVIRSEIARCRTILDHLSGRAAPEAIEEMETTLSRLLADVQYRVGESLAQRIDATLSSPEHLIRLPVEPLRQAIVALLRNAFDASAADQRVDLAIRTDGGGLRLEVVDRGRGMTASEATRAGEPFYTTKAPGGGLGMGLFLARAFAEQMGGTLQWQSVAGAGTTVVLHLPGR